MLTGSWLHHQIRFRWFPVDRDRRCDTAIRELFDKAVQECYSVVLLVLNSKLQPVMDRIEAGEECRRDSTLVLLLIVVSLPSLLMTRSMNSWRGMDGYKAEAS